MRYMKQRGVLQSIKEDVCHFKGVPVAKETKVELDARFELP